MTLTGKVALVTGGSSGIGRASALALAREGAQVVVSDVNVDGGEETVEHVRAAGGEAVFIEADVSRGTEVAAMVAAAVMAFGRLDCAVNNAGISGEMIGKVDEIDEATFDKIVSVNLKGVWLCMKHEIPYMLEQEGGVIVNMASVAGLIGSPRGAAYSASKHGVIGLTKSAAVEYARRNIRVNAVCPAFTDTPMVRGVIEKDANMEQITVRAIPMRRLGTPEEIAEGVVWLCSDASSFVTGHALVMDGGLVSM